MLVIPPEVLLYFRLFKKKKIYLDFCSSCCLVFPYERMDIFTILILQTHENVRSFLLEISSSKLFRQRLEVLSYKSLTCLVTITSRYFLLFDAFMKGLRGVVYLISFSVLLSFVYLRATGWFFKLILYVSTLLMLLSN